ncbi:serine hydrolase domain-containing protein [Lactobacillus sp.]|uniref:serine hydrolase domain-containing protein n=1 Tax=Lactobacillus sp. TaxID=1591 RepID=UPI003F044EC4
MTTAEIEEKITGIFKEAVGQKIVNGVSYAIVDQERLSQHYLGQAEPGQLYDLASLTKVVGTASGIFKEIDEGKISLKDRVGDFFPAAFPFVTVKDLLLHTSGLPADLDNVWQYQSPGEVWQAVLATKPLYLPGQESVYSDLNFIILGKILEQVSGQNLSSFLREEIFAPLGMRETGFLLKGKRDRFVKTEITKERGQVWGTVHDETAWQLGGVAGHAGLFSTLDDLACFSQAYLTTDSPLVASLFDYDCFERTLAWIRWQKGRRFLWHTGFTGPGLGFDFENGRALVILASSVYPKRGNEAWLLARRQAAKTFFACGYREGN